MKRVQELEGELSDYRKENHELKRKIASLLEKEETDRLYRQELEKVDKNANFILLFNSPGEIRYHICPK